MGDADSMCCIGTCIRARNIARVYSQILGLQFLVEVDTGSTVCLTCTANELVSLSFLVLDQQATVNSSLVVANIYLLMLPWFLCEGLGCGRL